MKLELLNRLARFWQDRDTPSRTIRVEQLRGRLADRLGADARLIVDESHRRIYSRDLADIPSFVEHALFRTTPLIVVQPRDTREIAEVLRFANEERIPVFPRGAASSAFGGPVPTTSGIVLDLSPMANIDPPAPLHPGPDLSDGAEGEVATAAEDLEGEEMGVRVDAGARWRDIDRFLEPYGLQLYTYPTNRLATVAGWLASGGYGINSLKYGQVSRHVEEIELVTPGGEIKTVGPADKDFGNYFATEGLMGVIARVTLRVWRIPEWSMPHLLYFETDADAFRFVDALAEHQITPATVKFHDANSMRLLNAHTSGVLLEEKPALLVLTDDAGTEARFTRVLRQRGRSTETPMAEAPKHIAGHLWADRFFPMKIRTLGPSLLGAQVVLPPGQAAGFLAAARRLALGLGLETATEGHVISTPQGMRVLTMPMFLTDQRKLAYSLHISFVSLLDRVGARFGGKPYNLGIWHAPFVEERYGRKRLAELRAFKKSQDPKDILNPGKFFRVGSRFAGIPGLLFDPPIFNLAMDVLQLALRVGVFRFAAHRVPLKARPTFCDIKTPQVTFLTPPGYNLEALARTALECTSCGMCVSVCPAYIHTKDERVTGRAKLWLARKLAAGEAIAQEEADAAWECVRCRACAEVCQSHLPLMLAWEKLEQELEPRFGRPEPSIRGFVSGLEKDPEYRAHIGLTLPGDLQEQRWLKSGNKRQIPEGGSDAFAPRQSKAAESGCDARSKVRCNSQSFNLNIHAAGELAGPTCDALAPLVQDQDFASPAVPAKVLSSKYHIECKSAPPRFSPINKVSIIRSEQCISCGHCVEACVYGVHDRNPLDVRRMDAPHDVFCRGCFRCIQECPRQALTIVPNEAYRLLGRGMYTPDVVSVLARQADDGHIPVLGAGYRGPFSGPGFDGMWTDMSEIVRPTRDGIHGREYISTAVDLGQRPLRLSIGNGGPALPPVAQIPFPILFGELPFHRAKNVVLAELHAAAELGTFVIVKRSEWRSEYAPFSNNIILHISDEREVDEFLAHFRLVQVDDPGMIACVKTIVPGAVTVTRSGMDLARVEELARRGAEVIHLESGWDGAELVRELPRIHARLLDAGLRDQVTLMAGGGIAMAEHVPKTIILGADAVVIDLPLLVALECLLQDECFAGGPCPHGVEEIDPAWGQQRIVNLMAAWRNQLLEVLGAMGLREVRRLRGERGRALWKSELDEKLFFPIFAGPVG